jgi:hypothetical protein
MISIVLHRYNGSYSGDGNFVHLLLLRASVL